MEQAPTFDIMVSHDGTTDIVTVRGEIDLVTAPLLRDAFAGLGPQITVDLRQVTFMDSSGLGVLLHQKAEMGGGELRVVAAGPPVLRLFEVSGLTEWLHPTPDLIEPDPKSKAQAS